MYYLYGELGGSSKRGYCQDCWKDVDEYILETSCWLEVHLLVAMAAFELNVNLITALAEAKDPRLSYLWTAVSIAQQAGAVSTLVFSSS